MHLVSWLIALFIPSFVVRGAVFEDISDLPGHAYDFIIVGGGTAGNALANRLTENPAFSVLVLEAGVSNEGVLDSIVPFFCGSVVPNTPFDWNFTTTPQTGLNGRSLAYPRGHILGGTSSVNFMAYLRGASADWDRYARITGDEGWSWDSLQSYISKNERWTKPADRHNTTGQFNPELHSTTGINSVSLAGFPHPIDDMIIQTTKEMSEEFPFNEDMNSGKQLGLGWIQVTVNGGKRSSSATSYLGPEFIKRPNLHVLLHARVTRILETKTLDFRTVEFVQVLQSDGATTPRQRLTAQKEVILSAGSVGTPHILLHSGIGDRSALSAVGIPTRVHLPSVGQNLSDHPLLPNMWLVNATDTFETAERNATLAAEQFQEWEGTQTGPLVDTLLDHLAWLRLPKDDPALEKFADPAAGNDSAHFEMLFLNGLIPGPALPATGNFLTIVTAVVAPLARGSVTLASSDPFAAPLIDPALLGSEFDLMAMRSAVRSTHRFLTARAWDGYVIEPFMGPGFNPNSNSTSTPSSNFTDAQLDAYIRSNTGTIYHPVGTAAMSPRGVEYGVVDPDLRVKGVKGLRVVDVSVLPIVPAAHTQGPAYIVAERAADLIKEAWK